MFVADVGYGQLNLTGSFGLERWPDIIYLSSTLLIALAGYFQAHPATSAEGHGKALSRWLLALPYVALAAGYSVLVGLAMGQITGELIEVRVAAQTLRELMLYAQDVLSRKPGAEIVYDVKEAADLGVIRVGAPGFHQDRPRLAGVRRGGPRGAR